MGKALAVIAAFGYLICPVDALPEILFGPLGYLDDLGVLALAAKYVMKQAPAQLQGPRFDRPDFQALHQQFAGQPSALPAPALPAPQLALPALPPVPAPRPLALPPKPKARSAAEIARLAADAAVRPFGTALSEERRLQVHAAVQEEVRKALRT